MKNAKELACGVCLLNVDSRSKVCICITLVQHKSCILILPRIVFIISVHLTDVLVLKGQFTPKQIILLYTQPQIFPNLYTFSICSRMWETKELWGSFFLIWK